MAGATVEEETAEQNKRLREFVDTISTSVAQGDVGLAAGFLPGARVEVLWIVASTEANEKPKKETDEAKDGVDNEDDDEEDGEKVWWPATVVGRTSRTFRLPEREEDGESGSIESLPVYELRYDSRPPEFPNPERSSVCVLDDHQILETDSETTFFWRLTGSTWEETDEDNDEHSTPEVIQKLMMFVENQATHSSDPKNMSPEESRALATTLVENLVLSLAEKHSAALNELPRANQNAIIDRVAQIKATMIEKVTACLMTTGKFTEQDAETIISEMRYN